MVHFRLNLPAIEACLRHVQRDFRRINEQLNDYRDPMTDEVVGNMMAGYGRVDGAIEQGIDLFAPGNSRHVLELNDVVLCRGDRSGQCCSPEHFEANERHFYDDRQGGFRDLVEWHELHRADSPWDRAAGIYVRVLSAPQLYIEGNHRTGALIMSYLLAREGRPPFVLTVDNARAYFDPSSLIKNTRKRSFAMLFKIPGIRKNFARFLRKQADDRFLLKTD
jgi:hypothetical protein